MSLLSLIGGRHALASMHLRRGGNYRMLLLRSDAASSGSTGGSQGMRETEERPGLLSWWRELKSSWRAMRELDKQRRAVNETLHAGEDLLERTRGAHFNASTAAAEQLSAAEAQIQVVQDQSRESDKVLANLIKDVITITDPKNLKENLTAEDVEAFVKRLQDKKVDPFKLTNDNMMASLVSSSPVSDKNFDHTGFTDALENSLAEMRTRMRASSVDAEQDKHVKETMDIIGELDALDSEMLELERNLSDIRQKKGTLSDVKADENAPSFLKLVKAPFDGGIQDEHVRARLMRLADERAKSGQFPSSMEELQADIESALRDIEEEPTTLSSPDELAKLVDQTTEALKSGRATPEDVERAQKLLSLVYKHSDQR